LTVVIWLPTVLSSADRFTTVSSADCLQQRDRNMIISWQLSILVQTWKRM